MKKLVSLLLSLLMLASCTAIAETPAQSAEVFVSITDAAGALVLAYVPVTVTDADADGMLTINDTLYCAHMEHYAAGEGYGSVKSEFGLSMTMLWGAAQGSSFGYYLNDASAWSLIDPVKDGDHVKAYVFTDLTAWSDTYCWFTVPCTSANAGSEAELTLTAAAFDEAWNPITLPVAGAVLTVDGKAADVLTNEEGKAVLTFAEAGVYVVSAASQTQNLVAPVCIVTVTAGE